MTRLGLKLKIKKFAFLMLNAKERFIGRLMEKTAIKSVQENGVHNVPVIINNYNRYVAMVKLVDWLHEAGHKNIIILDNQSDYPPLLDYYRRQDVCTVVYLGANFGHRALWKSGFYKKIKNKYFCYTDPDLVPVSECPKDLVSHLLEVLWRYSGVVKVGPGLRISDIPDHYEHKDMVIAWESQYWKVPVEKNVYKAALDTTFAIYRPRTFHCPYLPHLPSLRTGEPYVMHHTPWYEDSDRLTEEEIFYRNKLSGISWWSSSKNTGPNKITKFLK
ncbi:MAG: glycosyltransferase family 2 protein [Clostridia bacterium]|nr:glycosyltransferase family 2 protein [Clostridia bacterium]